MSSITLHVNVYEHMKNLLLYLPIAAVLGICIFNKYIFLKIYIPFLKLSIWGDTLFYVSLTRKAQHLISKMPH